MGNLQLLFLSGDYARGKDSGIIDLVLVGNVDKAFIADKVSKAEALIGKKIRYLVYASEEWEKHKHSADTHILLWEKQYRRSSWDGASTGAA